MLLRVQSSEEVEVEEEKVEEEEITVRALLSLMCCTQIVLHKTKT